MMTTRTDIKRPENKKIKILIADGNISYRNNLASKLRIDGYTVEFANGGFHLLHTLEIERDYDLVIIHENMADMSAAEIILLIRTTKTKNELPVFYISSQKVKDELEIAAMISKGASEYIIKAANFQPVLDRLAKYFPTSSKS